MGAREGVCRRGGYGGRRLASAGAALRAATGTLASQRVAEKAGFIREGVARNAGFTNAGRVDLVVYSLVAADLDQAGAGHDAQRVRAFYRGLPAKRMGAAVLFVDEDAITE
ncbi:MAG: GNAT family N-acetyltransferase [Candidatus Limnocylindria bacterium]